MRKTRFAIDVVDKWLTEMNLPFLATAIDVVLIAVLMLIIMRVSTRGVRYVLELRRKKLPESSAKRLMTVSSLVTGIIRVVCIFVAIAMILGELGLKNAMTSMLAAAGIGGIALGIGAQSLLGDMASGLFMLFENELDVGDYVKIGEIEGTVESVSLRSTALRGARGELIIVNNGQIKTVTNYSRGDYLMLVDVPVAYEADVDRAKAVMLEEAARYAAETGVDAKPRMFGVTSLDSSGITLRVGLSTPPADRWNAERTVRERIKRRFDASGIEIPYDKLVVLEAKRDQT